MSERLTAGPRATEEDTGDHLPEGSEASEDGPGSSSPAGGVASRETIRPLVMRLHFYAGVLVAPLLLLVAVSGLLYACSFQAEKIVYAHELSVPAGKEKLPLEKQLAAARSAHPEGTFNAVRPSAEAGATTRVLLDVPGLDESTRLAVFVDPYTGDVRGALEAYGSSGALPLRTWTDELHRGLHLGDPGRIYSELAASWLWVVTAGGLVLWIGRRRSARRLRRTLLPEGGSPSRRRTMSWHGSVGIWAAAGLFFLSATGLTWSQYTGENITRLRAALSWETPEVSGEGSHHGSSGGHGGHGEPGHSAHKDVGIDRVRQAALGKGLSGPVEVTAPAEPGAAWTVKQIKTTWPEKQDAVAVDAATGEVTEVLRFDDWPLAAKLSRWGIDAHMGLLFGIVNQAALAVLMIAVICLTVWGYRMWWLRRPTRKESWAMGRAPVRGAWRRVPVRILAPLVLSTAVVGYYLPLLGGSLLLFLAFDLGVGALRRRNGPRGTVR
ncbi:MAG TPA: PepSY-associated TM helix domain-containing protein [Streptomyces sp.]|nr:PepSY-associated TM helix domain-containing protein [Streptomyces sp.]